jgi:hypothetical protein
VGENRTTNRFGLLASRHAEVLAIGDLLVRAVAIEKDIYNRLAAQPKNTVLLKQQKQYERLISQLVWEHKNALADYLAAVRRIVRR